MLEEMHTIVAAPGKPAALAGLVTALALLALGAAQHASYQGPIPPDPALTAIEAAPVWRDRLDAPTAVVTEQAVVYLRDGRLVATELDGGWQQWSYGSGLAGPNLLVGDLLVVAEGIRVTVLDTHTGQPQWSLGVSELPVRYLQASSTTLLAGSGTTASVVNLTTGRLVHTIDMLGVGEPVYMDSGLALMRVTHGEPNVTDLVAYDLFTGRQLWSRAWAEVLAVDDGLVYLVGDDPAQHPAADFVVQVISSRTGAVTEQWEYSFGGLVANWRIQLSPPMVLTDADLIVAVGSQLYRFARGGAQRPATSYRASVGATLRAGPHLGLMLFEGADNSVLAVALDDGRAIQYVQAGAQLSRLDLYGQRAYVGRTDGVFKALDLDTGRARFMLRTGSTGFGPTLIANGFVIVQSATEVMVLEAIR